VIEHLGGHARRIAFADTATRLSSRQWIQTPNRFFPVEPHYWAPGAQFLPTGLRARAMRHWPLGNLRVVPDATGWPETQAGLLRFPLPDRHPDIARVPRHHAIRGALTIELLSASELQFYFPAAGILKERFAGLTKSLVAVRR
jgi:hypothetical protein